MSRSLQLVLVNQSKHRLPRAFLKTWIKCLDRHAAKYISSKKYRGRELVIAFVSDRESQKINLTYRKKNRPTDVLSFAGLDPQTLGELVIAPAVLEKQAREHGLSFRAELGYMVIHGFLHLLGYDHEGSKRDEKKMFKIQDELFEKLLASLE